VETVLNWVGFQHAADRAGISQFMASAGARDTTASMLIAELVKWFIRLVFLEVAAQALHVAASGMVNPQLMGNRAEWGSSPWRRWWPSPGGHRRIPGAAHHSREDSTYHASI
jgi:hypothetical protein